MAPQRSRQGSYMRGQDNHLAAVLCKACWVCVRQTLTIHGTTESTGALWPAQRRQ
ncbi:hypothetical protein B0I35DRAFT_433059 [Stachybotrys elegans]|uniref:Uncharacterized protein n=1 Tax=Stachybotrys elegans TaxID=80388 RepID=A0A8K0SPH4_9HYPO|nr:hypothetical protein B0I35DRAFT_433059 [Stachybotrys elegans]